MPADSSLVVEPQVIDLASLRDAVEPKPQEAMDPIEFPKVESLRLSYKNIAEISNLNNFDSLRTLRLDNNIIDRVENLDHLTNLTWLDLSFNNIREISGLENLKNLEDLSLYHNHIEEIGGLDNCKKLNVLSLGRNRISDLKQVNYLRKFPNLRCVCLEGNKICQSDSYQQHILAYLVNLTYLDYMLIDKKQVAQIQESYQLDELTELKEQESEQALQEKMEAERRATEAKLKLSFLDTTLNLFDELFPAEDVDEHITILNCYAPFKDEYYQKLKDALQQLYSGVQDRNDERLRLIQRFERLLKDTELASELEATELFKKFESKKKKFLLEAKMHLNDLASGGQSSAAQPAQLVDAIIKELHDDLAKVEHDLMNIEVELLTVMEDAIGGSESEVGGIMKTISNVAKDFFQQFEDIQNTFKNDLVTSANSEMESVMSQPDMSNAGGDDAKRQKLLSDREGMGLALSAFTDHHQYIHNSKDERMSEQMTQWERNYFDGKRKALLQRNRSRIIEIKNLVEMIEAEMREYSISNDEQNEDEDE